MARQPKPWYRKAVDAWYVTIGGRQHMLARGRASKAEATRAFHRLMAGQDAEPGREVRGIRSVAELCELFLDHAERANRPRTYETYRRYIASFVEACGGLRPADIRPRDVTRWLDSEAGWGQSVRSVATATAQRVFNWATKAGYLETSPLRHLEKPAMLRRERLLTSEEIATIRGAVVPGPFRDFLDALIESGCRPGEAAKVEAKDVDLEQATWTIEFKGNPRRVIYLTPALLEITRRLVAANPTGPIFRTERGEPWTRNTYGIRFRRLRDRLGLGKDVTAYLLRHAYVTDALVSGVPTATVAKLVGHKNHRMIETVYEKLAERKDHLRDAVRKVRPGTPGGGDDGT
jgi:integrase